MQRWHVEEGTGEHVVLTTAELKQWASDGRITPATPLRLQGNDRVFLAAEVKELFPKSPAATLKRHGEKLKSKTKQLHSHLHAIAIKVWRHAALKMRELLNSPAAAVQEGKRPDHTRDTPPFPVPRWRHDMAIYATNIIGKVRSRPFVAMVIGLLLVYFLWPAGEIYTQDRDLPAARVELVEKVNTRLTKDQISGITSEADIKRFLNAVRGADETYEKDAKFLAAVGEYADGKLRKDIFETYIKKVWPSQSELLSRPLQQAIRQGNTWAKLYFGLVHVDPTQGHRSLDSPESLLLPAEAQEMREQAYALAQHVSFRCNPELGMNYLEEAALENPRASAVLGYLLILGQQGAPYDPDRGVDLIQSAIDAGDAYGHYVLGVAYANGLGVEVDTAKALEHLQIAGEEMGLPIALTKIGEFYARGIGVEQDDAQAATYYRRAAKKGSADGARRLAIYCLLPGKGVKADVAQGIRLLETATEKGWHEAAFSLGYYYDKGQYVEKDSAQALKWYEQAAQGGNNRAMYNLAFKYAKGNGVTRNEESALHWYRKAGDAGHVNANLEVARRYRLGIGTKKNLYFAQTWYEGAALAETRQSGRAAAAFARSYREARPVSDTEFVNLIRSDPGVNVEVNLTSRLASWTDAKSIRTAFERLVESHGFKINSSSPYTLRCNLSAISLKSTINRESNQVGGSYKIEKYTSPVIYDMVIIRELPVWDGKQYLPHKLTLIQQYGFSVWSGLDAPGKILSRDPAKIVKSTLNQVFVDWISKNNNKPALSQKKWQQVYVPKLSDQELFRAYRTAEHLRYLYELNPLRLTKVDTVALTVNSNGSANKCISAQKQLNRITAQLKSLGWNASSEGHCGIYVNNLMIYDSGGKVFGIPNNPTYVYLTMAMATLRHDVLVPMKTGFVRLGSATLASNLNASVSKPADSCDAALRLSEQEVKTLLAAMRDGRDEEAE